MVVGHKRVVLRQRRTDTIGGVAKIQSRKGRNTDAPSQKRAVLRAGFRRRNHEKGVRPTNEAGDAEPMPDTCPSPRRARAKGPLTNWPAGPAKHAETLGLRRLAVG